MAQYPSEADLKAITEYDILKGITGLIALLDPEIEEYGTIKYENGILSISTGGWSGFEDVMEALKHNHVFWATCWQQSLRGGHYTFNIPEFLRK